MKRALISVFLNENICVLIAIILAFTGCSEDSPIEPQPVDPFASCDNGQDVGTDSLLYVYDFFPTYQISHLTVSSFNGWWAGEYKELGNRRGIFVYDPVSNTPIARYEKAEWHEWSPDGRKLLLLIDVDIWLVDVPSMALTRITDVSNEGLGTRFACWSQDGKHIIATRSLDKQIPVWPLGTFEMKPDGSEKRLLTESLWAAKTLDTSRIVALFGDSLLIYDINKNTITRVFTGIGSLSRDSFSAFTVSPSGEHIVIHARSPGNYDNPWANSLYIVNSKTWEVKKIRDAQRWDKPYAPSWVSNSSFYASVLCIMDSSSMVWEFDLNGNPIKQITTRQMQVWKE